MKELLSFVSVTLIVFCTPLQLQLTSAQDCLRANSDGGDSLPSFSDPGKNAPRIEPNPIQAIIRSYEFHCCGIVAGWAAYVEPGGGNHDGVYNIKFQIWRPMVMGGDRYEKIGENMFVGVNLDPSSVINEEVQSPNERLQFQPGDVLGYYLEQTDRGNNGGLQFDENFNQEELWYTTGSSDLQNECRLDIGTGGDLSLSTSLGPIISVSFTTTENNCPSTFTSTMFCPTPTSTIAMTTTMVPPTTSSMVPTMTGALRVPSTTSAPGVISTSQPVPSSTVATSSSLLENVISSTPQTSSHSSTPSPAHSSTPSEDAPTSTSSPSHSTPSPDTPNIPSTTDEITTRVSLTSSDNPTGLVVGFVVALLVVIVIATLTIVMVVVLMRRRLGKSGGMRTAAIVNPNYDDPTLVISSQTSKKFSRKPGLNTTPLVINASEAVYESLEGEYQGIPEALNYKLPQASVQYNPKTGKVKLPDRRDGPFYHALGPEAGGQYDYCGPGTLDGGSMIKSPLEGSAQYEVPTKPVFRTNTQSSDPFESEGIYVPTQAERQSKDSQNIQERSPRVYTNLQFFEEDQIYWAPADTASDLYQQLASKKYREIPRNQIIIQEELGSGQFGQVCKGLWSISDNSLQLAVKTLKPNAPETDKVKFLQEAAIMGQFLHPNVVKLYGVVTVGEPVMICLEIMLKGDLRNYLKSIDMISTSKAASQDLQLLFLRFAKEIATGMNYLSKKAFVHRDLAARNILLNDALTCKIGDFGMARDLMDDTYYTSSGGKIPVKWTAPEALLYKRYSTDSDVWSYGMVLFEIWSVGQKPFSMHTNNEVLRLIQDGYVQCPPPGCPREIYRLMVDCWNPEHQYRPKFGVICSRLQAPATKLLYWSPQDSTVSEKASVLGAPLEEGYNLHGDLKDIYKDYEDID